LQSAALHNNKVPLHFGFIYVWDRLGAALLATFNSAASGAERFFILCEWTHFDHMAGLEIDDQGRQGKSGLFADLDGK
jgi:hypothetical protein